MEDRQPTKPNRYAVYDDNHQFVRYEYHERADEPTVVGTALNMSTLLDSSVAAAIGLNPKTATPSEALDVLNRRKIPQASSNVLGGVMADPVTSSDTQPVHVNPGTGKLYTQAWGGPFSAASREYVSEDGKTRIWFERLIPAERNSPLRVTLATTSSRSDTIRLKQEDYDWFPDTSGFNDHWEGSVVLWVTESRPGYISIGRIDLQLRNTGSHEIRIQPSISNSSSFEGAGGVTVMWEHAAL